MNYQEIAEHIISKSGNGVMVFPEKVKVDIEVVIGQEPITEEEDIMEEKDMGDGKVELVATGKKRSVHKGKYKQITEMHTFSFDGIALTGCTDVTKELSDLEAKKTNLVV